MSVEMVLYLVDLLSKVFDFLNVICAVSLIGFGVLFVCSFLGDWGEEDYAIIRRLLKKTSFVFFVSVSLWLVVPSPKALYMMVGSHYLKNSELPIKVHTIINKKLDEFIEK